LSHRLGNDSTTELVEVTTTLPDEPTATRIAERLVNERLAACVQVTGPIQSFYRWQGNLERSTEWKLTIKTPLTCHARLIDELISNHPYTVPEILTHPLQSAHLPYAEWVVEQTR
jgi:periplasmic divalent cation tolerance protein